MSYEIWSEGKLRQKLAGIGMHFAQRTQIDISAEGWEFEDYCPVTRRYRIPHNTKRLIVLELVRCLRGDAVWVVSPLDTLIFGWRTRTSAGGQDRRRTLQRNPTARKQWESFHAAFPSVHMTHNGGLVLTGASISRGISCLITLYKMYDDSELEIVMPQARAVICLCHDGGIHFGTKNIESRDTLSKVFYEVTGEAMPN